MQHDSTATTIPVGQPRAVFPEGTRIGRYEILALAGRGGMGQVYRAWDTQLERHVALKAVLPGDEDGGEALERFRREAMALAQLNHPCVCQVYDLVDAAGETFLAMEWVEGRTLDLVANELDLRQKLSVLQEAAQGLAAAHAKGLVHRDFKPTNVMVDPQGHARILDFGLARLEGSLPDLPPMRPEGSGGSGHVGAMDEAISKGMPTGVFAMPRDQLTRQGFFMGSPPYASPEQIERQLAGPETDVWSLGVVAWELLGGEHPFEGEGFQLLRNILMGRPRMLKAKRLPRALPPLLEAMLARETRVRPTAQEVADRLQRILNPDRTWAWVAGAAAAALLCAYAAFAFATRGVVADLVRSRPARVAVFPIENATGLASLDSVTRWVLPELVCSGLKGSRRLQAVDPEEVARAAQRLRLDVSRGYSPEQRELVLNALGARLMITARLEKAPSGSALLPFELRDGKGRIRHQGTPSAPSVGEDSVGALAREALGSIRKAVDPLGSGAPVELPALDADSLRRYGDGKGLTAKGDFKAAEPLLRQVAYAYPDFTPAVLDLARCLARLGTQPPEPVFQWARMGARAAGNRRDELRCLHALSQRLLDRGQREEALRSLQEAQVLAEHLGDEGLLASVHSAMGTALHQLNRVDEARTRYLAALDAFRRTEDRLAASRVLNNLAVMERNLGRLESADTLYRESLGTARAMRDRWGEAVALNNLGDLGLARGQGREAEQYFHKAIELRGVIGDDSGMTYSLVGLASVFQARGDLAQAGSRLQQALEAARKQHLQPMEGLCLYNLGELAREAHRFGEARERYAASFAIHKGIADAVMQAHCLAGEAECIARETPRRAAEASALLKKALALSPEETPYILRARAWISRAGGDPAAAATAFRRAFETARQQAPELVRELSDPPR